MKREEMIETSRVWTRLPKVKYDKMQLMADALGMSLAQFVAVCAWTGAQRLMPHLEPGGLSVSEWEELYEENDKRWQMYFDLTPDEVDEESDQGVQESEV